MSRILLTLVIAMVACYVSFSQVRLASKYSFPLRPNPATARDSMLNELKSIRGCAFAVDVDGDNRSEIAATSYGGAGGVSVFEAVGNDSLRLVWTSPRVASGGGGSTPRYVLFGDLDNDGKKEVIYQSNANGIYIFEWDGVIGSDNYGTAPSQIIGAPFITNVTGNAEYMEVADLYGDSKQELLVAYNSSTNADDKYYVISADGEWTTGDPGFSSFNVNFSLSRTDIRANAYGLGGSPVGMIAANLDGTGLKEILIHNFNLKNVFPMRVTGPSTFALPDTTTGKGHLYLGGTFDDVALFGGIAHDIDGDGREEVYLPTFPFTGSTNSGFIDMISYNAGQSTTIIDSTNDTKLSVVGFGGGTTFGYGYGDMNANGKKEIYVSSTFPANVVALEFQGGDKRNPANWIPRFLYRGDSTIYTSVTYRDSVGRRDTVRVIDPSFASKMYGRNTDFDRDGREDIILPYQALSDSMTVTSLLWNATASRYDTVTSGKVANPKRWSLRVIERDPTQGVEGKDLTIITPEDYRLEQNYPNPFNPSTTIKFYLPIRDRISLKVFDILGKEVRTLINNESYESGVGGVVWDGKDNFGKIAATGTYFYTLRFGNFEKTNKMLLVK